MNLYKLFLPILSIAVPFSSSYADNNNLVASLDSIVEKGLPPGTDISIQVWDLDGDSAIYGYRENVLNRPASTMKILTAYTALKTLGSGYTFQTNLMTDGVIENDSTLNGNLYLVGGLDPQLMENDLKKMVLDLKSKGIRTINGKVIADVSMMDSIYWGPGWAWDDTPSSFQPYISPLMVHGGFIGISVKPGQKGMPPVVSTFPDSKYYNIDNRAVTGDNSLGTLTIRRNWLENDNTIIISGNSAKGTSKEQNIFNSGEFTFALFREYLEEGGIGFTDYEKGLCPDSAIYITSARHSLLSVLDEALKESVNLNAEALFLQSVRSSGKVKTNFSKAAEFEELFIKKNIKPGSQPFHIADGSGLSMYDYIPASLFVSVLRSIYKDSELYKIIYGSLPISGKDGTLKNRMKDKGMTGRIHAKTGTVTGACTLAGYASSSHGRTFAFCIMNSGAVTMKDSRKVQDEICTLLCK
ncbi:MAG: D-alanyl-D-alanine carboxypeptidase/D-alanyl-D-alanine-endopeptidase [Bacteroidaceae bacterium]|nr:D-alanyl-D-alanine carboxypeptidase/D-alanyl-D-alanine-endopeptidase [Bacteroidaceae bacterium]